MRRIFFFYVVLAVVYANTSLAANIQYEGLQLKAVLKQLNSFYLQSRSYSATVQSCSYRAALTWHALID